jgi:hypothetical protein
MNTVASLMFTFNLFRHINAGHTNIDFKEAGSQVGFQTKQVDHLDRTQCIFLKGCMLGGVGERYFVNLPSLVLKMGKHTGDICLINRTRDVSLALRHTAGAMGRSLPQYPLDFPVLGSFLSALRRVGTGQGELSVQDIQHHKAYGQRVDRLEMIKFMIQRYDTSVEEILELEELYNTIVAIPAWVTHPLLAKMTLCDYY